jgi:Flp pilus assembly protein TadG
MRPRATPTAAGRRDGAAAVEFAVVVPVLIILVFGMIEFSRLMMVEQVLDNAAREGCRRAVLNTATTSDVNTVVTNYLNNSGISGESITVSPDPSTASAGTAITVTVSVPFSSVSWLPHPMFLGGATLTASVVMCKESNNT